MKINLLKTIYMLSKYFLYGFSIQLLVLNFVMASEVKGQYKSIDEVQVRIEKKNLSLTDFFQTIEKQTQFNFLYDQKQVNGKTKVQIVRKNGTVESYLKEVGAQAKLSFRQVNNSIDTKPQINEKAPTEPVDAVFKVVTGTVSDHNGEPLPGASVLIKGTSTGTVTDLDGKYSINVDQGKVLVFSFIGYGSKEITVGNASEINVVLSEDMSSLGEVVVVGYGTQKKANITGSIAQIEPENLTERPIQRVDQALVGQMAGVRVKQTSGVPGRGFDVQVRGVGSITANNQPLYVIDGFPLESSGGNPMDNISPNDIESIQVLKDASAAAIYGSRASNGVVIINTKTGKEGKAKINFNSYVGWNETVKKLDVLSPTEWIDRATEMINTQWENSGEGRSASQSLAEREAILGGFNRNYMYDPRWMQEGYPGLRLVEWQDHLFRKGLVQNYQLSASGGNDFVKYFVSGDYMDQEGIAVGVNYKRYSTRANVEIQANEKLKFGLNLSPSYSILDDPGVEGKDAITHTTVGMAPVVEEEAGLLTGIGDVPLYTWASSRLSPIAYARRRLNQTTIFRNLATVYGEYEFTKGLAFKSTLNVDNVDQQNKNYTPAEITRNRQTSGGFNGYRKLTFVNENTLSFNRTFNEDHNLNAVVGMSYNFNKRNTYQMSGNFDVEGITTLNAAIINAGSTNTTETQSTLVSYFGRVQYDYLGKYLISASARRDGSSRFGQDTKWGFFPSLSLGWRLSDEDFMQGLDAVSDLKIRGSWGLSGNNGIGDYSHIATLDFANYSYGGTLANGLIPGNFPNSGLGWEESEMTNIGFDLGILENRFYTSFDYYWKNNTNLLLNIPVPSATGFTTALTNIGEVLNKGWEWELTSRNITGQFEWTTNLNLSHNTNEVKQLGPENTPILGGSFDINHRITMVGEPMNTLYLVQNIGILTQEEIDNGAALYGNQEAGDPQYLDANGDGVIDPDDRILSGAPTPDYIWGLTNNFSYKGFDLNILVQGQWGGLIYSTFGRAMDRPGMGYVENTLGRHRNRWRSPENPGDGETGKAVSSFGRIKNTDWLYSSDYWRIRNITLGYDLGRIIENKNLLSGGRVYVTAENFFGDDKYTGGFNPEAVNNNGDDYGAFPLSKSVVFGVNLKF
ncbi:TonB-dependent receptor [Echinicola jeungdonensis]|uniref:TonB-dependent receptor n=1 Tax=Echinicola jeungdonensis TaxID=709343 RepID=A0ABV5J8B8_9BACT|nr:TonB-dependent receptor [Echinicola jeungdonensis]MDN3669485.1 TonB-dependent receptor [Echinicola jeungdonensis]